MADSTYPAPDLTPLSTIPAANKIAGQNLLTGQKSDINDFTTAQSNFYNDPKNNLTAIGSRTMDELGLPTLQANANTINTNFSNLPFTYREATAGHDVNNNQLNRIVNQKQIDMTPGMTSANNALAAGENQFGLRMSQAATDIANRGIPFQSQQALMMDRMAREATMFTTENQQELDGLVAKINAGVTLNQGDLNRANALAVAEKSYQAAIQSAQITANRPFALTPGQSVYSPSTNTNKSFGWS